MTFPERQSGLPAEYMAALEALYIQELRRYEGRLSAAIDILSLIRVSAQGLFPCGIHSEGAGLPLTTMARKMCSWPTGQYVFGHVDSFTTFFVKERRNPSRWVTVEVQFREDVDAHRNRAVLNVLRGLLAVPSVPPAGGNELPREYLKFDCFPKC